MKISRAAAGLATVASITSGVAAGPGDGGKVHAPGKNPPLLIGTAHPHGTHTKHPPLHSSDIDADSWRVSTTSIPGPKTARDVAPPEAPSKIHTAIVTVYKTDRVTVVADGTTTVTKAAPTDTSVSEYHLSGEFTTVSVDGTTLVVPVTPITTITTKFTYQNKGKTLISTRTLMEPVLASGTGNAYDCQEEVGEFISCPWSGEFPASSLYPTPPFTPAESSDHPSKTKAKRSVTSDQSALPTSTPLDYAERVAEWQKLVSSTAWPAGTHPYMEAPGSPPSDCAKHSEGMIYDVHPLSPDGWTISPTVNNRVLAGENKASSSEPEVFDGGIALINGTLINSYGLVGGIVSNDQYQYDKPSQAGTKYNSGWCIQNVNIQSTTEGSDVKPPTYRLFLGDKNVFWDCGTTEQRSNFYYSQIDSSCHQVAFVLTEESTSSNSGSTSQSSDILSSPPGSTSSSVSTSSLGGLPSSDPTAFNTTPSTSHSYTHHTTSTVSEPVETVTTTYVPPVPCSTALTGFILEAVPKNQSLYGHNGPLRKRYTQLSVLSGLFNLMPSGVLTNSLGEVANFVVDDGGELKFGPHWNRTMPIHWSICDMLLQYDENHIQGYYQCDVDGTSSIYSGSQIGRKCQRVEIQVRTSGHGSTPSSTGSQQNEGGSPSLTTPAPAIPTTESRLMAREKRMTTDCVISGSSIVMTINGTMQVIVATSCPLFTTSGTVYSAVPFTTSPVTTSWTESYSKGHTLSVPMVSTKTIYIGQPVSTIFPSDTAKLSKRQASSSAADDTNADGVVGDMPTERIDILTTGTATIPARTVTAYDENDQLVTYTFGGDVITYTDIPTTPTGINAGNSAAAVTKRDESSTSSISDAPEAMTQSVPFCTDALCVMSKANATFSHARRQEDSPETVTKTVAEATVTTTAYDLPATPAQVKEITTSSEWLPSNSTISSSTITSAPSLIPTTHFAYSTTTTNFTFTSRPNATYTTRPNALVPNLSEICEVGVPSCQPLYNSSTLANNSMPAMTNFNATGMPTHSPTTVTSTKMVDPSITSKIYSSGPTASPSHTSEAGAGKVVVGGAFGLAGLAVMVCFLG